MSPLYHDGAGGTRPDRGIKSNQIIKREVIKHEVIHDPPRYTNIALDPSGRPRCDIGVPGGHQRRT